MQPAVQLAYGTVLIAAPTAYVGVAVWRLFRYVGRFPEGRAGYNQARLEADDNPAWLTNRHWLSARVALVLASFTLGVLEVREALERF